MKICFVSDATDIHTHRWAGYFANRGHDVHIISFDRPSEDIGNISLHILRTVGIKMTILKYTINPLYVLKQLKKLIKEIKPDIIHGHSVRDHTILTALIGFHPFVVTAWGSDVLIHPKESKVMKYAVPFTLQRADLITSDGNNAKEVMIKMGIEDKKIKTILHGIDTKKFNPLHKDTNIFNNLKIVNSPTIISTRRLGHIHDVETLIRAIPSILEEMPDAKFVIVGEGKQKECLMNLAKSLGIFDATRFVGWIPNKTLPKYLASIDVYVSTSLSDSGLAAGTAEAMACGLPVIITDFGDNRKWVEDGVNGCIVPLKDPKPLAEKIIYLLKNKDVRTEFGIRNRTIIEDRSNHYKEMGKMENIYRELIAGYKL